MENKRGVKIQIFSSFDLYSPFTRVTKIIRRFTSFATKDSHWEVHNSQDDNDQISPELANSCDLCPVISVRRSPRFLKNSSISLFLFFCCRSCRRHATDRL